MNAKPKSEIRNPKSQTRNTLVWGFRFRISYFGFLFVLLLVFAAGCGGRGTVSGQVLYKGKPVPGGWVTFRPVDGSANTVNARIDQNGHYEATLPTGEVKIAVDNRDLQPVPAEDGSGPALPPMFKLPAGLKPGPKTPPAAVPSESASEKLPGDYVPIPEEYYTVESSHLTYTVKRGPQTHDIELK